MKIWTYQEMREKLERDLDLEDETFIKPDELAGYFNEALAEAESEILLLNQDYLLTKYYLPLTVGEDRYLLPDNIYANKIRGIMFRNGSEIYPVKQFRRKGKFEDIAMSEQYGVADPYGYILVNDYVGQTQLQLLPPSRDLAVLSPVASLFTPMTMWYIRNCARVPMIGEYCNPEIVAVTQVDTTANTIQTYSGTKTIGTPQQGLPGAYPGSIAYTTGMKVKLSIGPNGTLPSPLVEDTVYFVIAQGSGVIKLATTLQNAQSGTAIDLTTTGTVYFTIKVAATEAIVEATLIDIPEFATFILQWVKCRCLEKEGDPRIETAGATLIQQKKQMIDTLVKGIDDDDDTIQADFTFYEDMS